MNNQTRPRQESGGRSSTTSLGSRLFEVLTVGIVVAFLGWGIGRVFQETSPALLAAEASGNPYFAQIGLLYNVGFVVGFFWLARFILKYAFVSVHAEHGTVRRGKLIWKYLAWWGLFFAAAAWVAVGVVSAVYGGASVLFPPELIPWLILLLVSIWITDSAYRHQYVVDRSG